MIQNKYMKIKELINEHGTTYSSLLGIKLTSANEREIFKWFLASLLFGKPIQEKVAMRTYNLFVKSGLTSPERIIKAGWDGLVEVLDEGGYVRYDFSTATKLLEIMGRMNEKYGGSLIGLHGETKDSRDLESKLLEFKGIGPTTVNIFLREMRAIWPKADPEPSEYVKIAAKKLGIKLSKFKRSNIKFIRLETALTRIGRLRPRPRNQ